jgi:hypothetical protein
LSFNGVLDDLGSVEDRIKKAPLEVPYNFERESLEKAKELFLKWLEIYKMYANGYRMELIPRTSRHVIRMLSAFTNDLENQVRDVLEARILNEAYLLVANFLEMFTNSPPSFVLAEFKEFKQTTISTLLQDKLENLHVPGPSAGTASVDIISRDIKNRDILVICYDHGQFDNVLSWPLLLHETFHYFYETQRLDRLAKDCPEVSWLEEALIDMYVVNYFGPAYALSLATYLQKFPHEKTVSHPSFASRIFITLKYLEKMQEEKMLPSPSSEHVVDVFGYLTKVWDEHKESDSLEVQEQVSKIYDTAEKDVKELIAEKTKPFSSFLMETEKRRREVHEKAGFEFAENQVLSVSDVIEYFEAGIPAAADPRVVFNSFISKRYQHMINDRRINLFIKESLKKWHLKNAWLKTKKLSFR